MSSASRPDLKQLVDSLVCRQQVAHAYMCTPHRLFSTSNHACKVNHVILFGVNLDWMAHALEPWFKLWSKLKMYSECYSNFWMLALAHVHLITSFCLVHICLPNAFRASRLIVIMSVDIAASRFIWVYHVVLIWRPAACPPRPAAATTKEMTRPSAAPPLLWFPLYWLWMM